MNDEKEDRIMSSGRSPVPLKGFTLPCPCCGEENASISLNFYNLGDEEEFTCNNCEASFGMAFIRGFLKKWAKVIVWVEAAPQFKEDK